MSGRRMPTRVPHAWLASVAVVLWFGYLTTRLGVDLPDVIRYVAYLAVVTFPPGLALTVFLWRERLSPAAVFALGAAMGYVLEAAAFVSLAIIQVRWLWQWYPVIGALSVIALGWRWWRSRGERRSAGITVTTIWARVVAICLVVTVNTIYLAYLGSVPVGRETLVPVGPDMFLHLSSTAEMLHHWPITDARFAGVPFSYHLMANVHLAAASAITGIELHVLLMRLFLGPMLALSALSVCVMTRLLAQSLVVELCALAMVFFAGTNDLAMFSSSVWRSFKDHGAPPYLGDPWGFTGGGLYSGIGPSYVFGLVMFLPLVCVTLPIVSRAAVSRGQLLVIGLLMAASMLAKGSFMPVYIAGLIMAATWLWLRGTGRWRTAAWLAALALVICVPLYFLTFQQYWQGGGEPIKIALFGIVRQTEIWTRVEPLLSSLWESGGRKGIVDWTYRVVALLIASLLVVVFFVVSYGTRVLGAAYHLRRSGFRMRPNRVVLLSMIACGVAPACLVSLTDGNQMHFLNTAYPLAGVLGAVGLGHLILTRTRGSAMRWLAIAVLSLSTTSSAFFYWGMYQDYEVAQTIRGGSGMLTDSGLYQAQRWIRANTSPETVLAASPYSEELPALARRVDYSALAERRVFFEGYYYLKARDPAALASRRALLTAVFRDGDAVALETMRQQFGVEYLVVETSDKRAVKLPEAAVSLVFENAAARVYRVKDISG